MPQNYELNNELFKLCTQDALSIDIAEVRRLLKAGADANTSLPYDLFPMAWEDKLTNSFPLLHVISRYDNAVEVAKLLIEFGADITTRDNGIGNTPLLTAIALQNKTLAKFYIPTAFKTGDSEILKTLSQADHGSECQNTPLILAQKTNMDDVALMLIQCDANPNAICRDGQTAMHWACMLRKNDVISALLQSGADARLINNYDVSTYDYYIYNISLIDVANPIDPQHPTIAKSHTSNMSEFSDLYHFIDNAQIFDALMKKIIKRNKVNPEKDIIEQLKSNIIPSPKLTNRHQAILEQQFTLNKQYFEKQPKSTMSIFNNNRNFLNKLINDCQLELEEKNSALLSISVKNMQRDNIEKYIQDPQQINSQDEQGFTALHWAAMRRDNAMIKKLMEAGADPMLVNNLGRTPLDYYSYVIQAEDMKGACKGDLFDTVRKMLPKGVSEMPEFSSLFNKTEAQITLGTWKRNTLPVDLELFNNHNVTEGNRSNMSI